MFPPFRRPTRARLVSVDILGKETSGQLDEEKYAVHFQLFFRLEYRNDEQYDLLGKNLHAEDPNSFSPGGI